MASLVRWYKGAYFARGSVSDQLSCTWTAIIFLVFGIVMYWLQIYISPIHCWVPAEFTDPMAAFSNKHCWYANKIYPTTSLPVVKEGILEEEGTYTIYQWLPLFFIFQSLFFKLPDIIWKCGLSTIGINPSKLVGTADGYGNLEKAERKLVGKQMARYLYNYVLSSTMKGCPWGMLSLLWIFVKSLYFVNVVTQFGLMRKYFLDYKTLAWMGYHNVNMTSGNDTPIFPKSVLCSFVVRKYNLYRYSIQCDLTVNRWYELVCGVLTVWLLIVLFITTVSCFIDALKFTIPLFRKRFMESYLSMIDDTTLKPQETGVSYFASFLGQDVVIILKLLAQSTSELLVGDTVVALWEIHSGFAASSRDPPLGCQHQSALPLHVFVAQGGPRELQYQPGPPNQQGKSDEVPLVPVTSGSNISPKPT